MQCNNLTPQTELSNVIFLLKHPPYIFINSMLSHNKFSTHRLCTVELQFWHYKVKNIHQTVSETTIHCAYIVTFSCKVTHRQGITTIKSWSSRKGSQKWGNTVCSPHTKSHFHRKEAVKCADCCYRVSKKKQKKRLDVNKPTFSQQQQFKKIIKNCSH